MPPLLRLLASTIKVLTIMYKMTALQEVRSFGFKDLHEVGTLCNKHHNTVRNWHSKNYTMFRVVLLGCVVEKEIRKGRE